MNKLITALCLGIILSVCAFAQTDNDEYKKNEYYVGYSNQSNDAVGRQSLNGFEAAYVRNVHRYFGIKADVSAGFKRDSYNFSYFDPTTNTTTSYRGKSGRATYNFLGGIQIKDNASKARLKPFAHALIGVAVNRFTGSNSICTSPNCPSSNNNFRFANNQIDFAAALGGGLDIKINDKIDLRAIQVDYNPTIGYGRSSNNFLFGAGIVFK
jgi:hypothetical protein